jgi:phytoene dehydrogenase-like protein
MKNYDVLIIGGGIAGLTAAAVLSRAGKRVIVFERASAAGGYAHTQVQDGFHLNLGPHALFISGEGAATLKELGIPIDGEKPSGPGIFLFNKGKLFPVPGTLRAALVSDFLPWHAKLALGRFLYRLRKTQPETLAHCTVEEWLGSVKHELARNLLLAAVRVSSYTNAPHLQSAEMAANQLQKPGVIYLHGGWQTLSKSLGKAAELSGGIIRTSTKVKRVIISGNIARGVQLDDGTIIDAESLILALPPREASVLLPESAMLAEAASNAIPVRAAILDVGLRCLPVPDRNFVLGVDRPLYYSVHSRWARLAPPNGAVIHVARYLQPGETGDAEELEDFLEFLQPDWRSNVVVRRFAPAMTVNSATVTAAQGGFAGRPSVASEEFRGLYLAGDWIGRHGFLADASFASGKEAANVVLQSSASEKRNLELTSASSFWEQNQDSSVQPA